jgi:hypothetical protein
MEKISRSIRQAKQAKKLMLTVPVRTVRTLCTVTWQGHTDCMMMCQMVTWQYVGWLTVGESGDDTCPFIGKWYEDTWPNLWAPRVTHWLVIGCM